MTTGQPLIEQEKLRRFLEREARHWGIRVRDRRKFLGLTLEQAAILAGTTPQTVFKVERGQIVARDNLRLALAFALSCEAADLFPIPTRATIAGDVA